MRALGPGGPPVAPVGGDQDVLDDPHHDSSMVVVRLAIKYEIEDLILSSRLDLARSCDPSPR